MTAWHVAPALKTFIDQLNEAFPHRDTRSDGTIGDLRHQTETGGSDHDPDSTGTVCAFDGTHGPYWHLSLADAGLISSQLVASGDERIAYVIFNRRIWTKAKGWHDYTGTSPHLEHFHLSVFHGDPADDARPWGLPAFNSTPTTSVVDLLTVAAVLDPAPEPEDDDMPQYFRNTQGGAEVRVDGGWYAHLTPPQAALETANGAQFTALDNSTFVTLLSSKAPLPGQDPVV